MSTLADLFSVRSEQLKQLREIIGSWESLKPHLGDAASFSLVFKDATPQVLSFVAEASKLAREHQDRAKVHLEKALSELEIAEVHTTD